MRILFLTQVLPYPLDAGPRLRAYYVLRHLAAHHEVLLVSFTRPDDAPEAVAHLRHFCAGVYTTPMLRSHWRTMRAAVAALAHDQPVIIARDRSAAMHALIASVMAEHAPIDAVHADQTSMVQYALFAAAQGSPRPRLVLDAHNALHQVFHRLAEQARNPLRRRLLAWEADRLEAYERRTYAQFDAVVFVTATDRACFALPAARVIPICVEPAAPIAPVANAPPQVLFVGTLFWPPNAEGVAWFIREVWPAVRARCADARLLVVGKRPPAALMQLAAITPGVEMPGYVADLAGPIAQSAVFVVPLHAGGGMRVKIVDAWSWELPVVATTIGAEGLDYVADEQLLIADDADAFAAATARLLADPALAARLRRAGRQRVETAYDWQRVYPAWDAIYPPSLPKSPAYATLGTLCN
jgi:glycosyltransferase involved in cell wall biosynthesis